MSNLGITDIVSIAGGMTAGLYAYEKQWDKMWEECTDFMNKAEEADSKCDKFLYKSCAIGSITKTVAVGVGAQIGTTLALEVVFSGLKDIF